ncbi:alginate O-acetyltransferase AlgF [Deinococcus ruber]|uniref:Alginate biosynthesis protein AlgF n=1 Tax=Deinococcus ruber TaxID=1848197 RepID=A0A918F4L2_9DEIO|nr:alginate O-acetyltransferase AlgF [Deinococcus ruber]GGR00431.1 alginate biosynthesis protein AlgF [Deinococcus ruber]
MKLILTLAVLTAGAALAQDTGLYAPAPPANSAFVRVLNAPTATLGSASVTAPASAASPYVVIPQGEFTAKLGATSSKLTVVAGHFYSVVAVAGKLVLLTDQAADNKAKALLTIYNLSKTASIDLKTADGKTSVVSGVKTGESGSRAVNGITVDLAAFNGPKALGTLKGVKLERGNAYALVLTDTGLTLTTSTTQTK